MEVIEIIRHCDKLECLKEMIIGEYHRLENLKSLASDKNWLFYGHDQIVAGRAKYSYQIEIAEMALERLKNYYINNLKL